MKTTVILSNLLIMAVIIFNFTVNAQIKVISGGNVGIGTTTPGEKLEIGGKLKMGDNIMLNGKYLSNDGGNEGIRIDNNGWVGINEASPFGEFQINNNSIMKIVLGKAYTGADYWGSTYLGFNAGRSSGGTWTLHNDGYSNGGCGIITNAGGRMDFFTIASTGGSNQTFTDAQLLSKIKMTITSSGNVGIGTTTPLSVLSIGSNSNSSFYTSIYSTLTGSGAQALNVIAQKPASDGTWGHSIYGYITCGNGQAVGTRGVSYNSTAYNSGRSYGVWGQAGNSTNGYNYGVYGILSGSNKGAAVYGTTAGDVDVNGFWSGYFYGQVKISDQLCVNTTWYQSDNRLKKNIIPVENVTEKLFQLNAVEYKYKTKKELISDGILKVSDTTKTDPLENKLINYKHFGYIAQEVKEIFPNLVYTDEDGLLNMNYTELIPIIIEALKEKSGIITDQQGAIDSLKKEFSDCCNNKNARTILNNSSSSISDISGTKQEAKLYQNNPNPFTVNTEIGYTIPDDIKSASILVFDMQGVLLKTIEIRQKGNGSITISGGELKPGMYLYSLITDNKEVDTKRMILTE